MSEKLNEIMDKINNIDRKIQGVSTSAKNGIANIKLGDPVSSGINGAVEKTFNSLHSLEDKGIVGKTASWLGRFVFGLALLSVPVFIFIFGNKLDKQGNTFMAYLLGAIAIWFILATFGKSKRSKS